MYHAFQRFPVLNSDFLLIPSSLQMQATLRPLFKHEVDVRVSDRPLRYYTNNPVLPHLLPGRPNPPIMLDMAPLAQDPSIVGI
jgi:hypothetical protein